MKKAIASFGIQNYLIDGFPACVDDIEEFNSIFQDDITFEGYLHINLSEKKLMENGIEAFGTESNIEEKEEKIKDIIATYLKESEEIKTNFERSKKLKVINGNNGPELAYQ